MDGAHPSGVPAQAESGESPHTSGAPTRMAQILAAAFPGCTGTLTHRLYLSGVLNL